MSRNTVRKVLEVSGETLIRVRACCPAATEAGQMGSRTRRAAGRGMRPSPRSASSLTLIRIFEEPRGRGYDGGYDAVLPLRPTVEQGERGGIHGCGLRPAELCRGRGEAYQFDWSQRSRPAQWRNGDREGRPCPALSQPDAVCAVLSARRHRRWCSTPTIGHSLWFNGTCVRGIYDNMKTAAEDDLRSAKGVSTIAASCRCAATTWSIR